MSNHFKDSANRVARPQHLINFFFHSWLSVGIGTVQQHFIFAATRLNFGPRNFAFNIRFPDRNHVTQNLNSKFAQ